MIWWIFFRITFPSVGLKRKRKKEAEEADVSADVKPVLEVEPYQIPNRGPYPFNQPKK